MKAPRTDKRATFAQLHQREAPRSVLHQKRVPLSIYNLHTMENFVRHTLRLRRLRIRMLRTACPECVANFHNFILSRRNYTKIINSRMYHYTFTYPFLLPPSSMLLSKRLSKVSSKIHRNCAEYDVSAKSHKKSFAHNYSARVKSDLG